MDIDIEQHGTISGWEPPVGNVLSPGFEATMISLFEAGHMLYANLQPDSMTMTRNFIDKLEQKGYCIAKYIGE